MAWHEPRGEVLVNETSHAISLRQQECIPSISPLYDLMLHGEQRALGLDKCYPELKMQRSAPEVTEAALALSEEERGRLAEKLVQSLDGDLDPDAESAWAAEIERRLARIDAGQSSALPMEEAIARMRRAVYKR